MKVKGKIQLITRHEGAEEEEEEEECSSTLSLTSGLHRGG
jgi:hypothetical protein